MAGLLIVGMFWVCLFFAAPAAAADGAVSDVPYLLNTLWLLISGMLVMWMAAGFTMLEAGSVRSKSVGIILIKNIGLYSIAGLMFYLVGYNLMFGVPEGGFFGNFGLWATDDSAALAGSHGGGHASNAFWFFQMVFVATASSVVSGALAERVKLWPFFVFAAILTGVIYPLVGAWTWGGGWLGERGFSDFAGSTIVHSVGGWAALAGAILLGARSGRFDSDGKQRELLGASAPQIALGVLILWFGWFGFNGGSQLSFSSVEDAIAVAGILANTNAAAAAGVIAALVAGHFLYRRVDLALTFNGALAGLVAITAEPSAPSLGMSALIGASGCFVMIGVALLLERAKIDDVVGAIPVHLGAGIWGTIIAGFTNPDADIVTQLIGIGAIGAFVFLSSLAVWILLKKTVGIRLHIFDEKIGADIAEMGISAHNIE